MLVSLAAATVLMTGLASCLFLSVRSFDGSATAAVTALGADVQSTMLADLSEATSFINRASDAVSFMVPDRDGDGDGETITYAWSPEDEALNVSINGSSAATLLENVTHFQLGYGHRVMAGASPTPPPFDSNDWGLRWEPAGGSVAFEQFSEEDVGWSDNDIEISRPEGTAEGDLLIAAVATDDDNTASLSAPAGWNVIVVEDSEGEVTLGVWWKIAGASEPSSYEFTWSHDDEAYGWIMRFTGHDATDPINAWSLEVTGSGETDTPPSPAVTTTTNDSLILRLAAFDDDDIDVGEPGLPDHEVITMDRSGNGNGTTSGGAGYVFHPNSGDSGESTFSLKKTEEAVAVTLAIAPAAN